MAKGGIASYVAIPKMHADIQKLVEAGKLTTKAGAVLSQLTPGSFCLHKSWGFGEIDAWNLLVNQISIHFQNKKSHPMQLQYAADTLQPIPPEHILAQKITNLDGIKRMAREEPKALVRLVLHSLGGKATVAQIGQALAAEVFNEAEFKRWWESAKRDLRSDGHFSLPAKKTEPVVLREEAVSNVDELIAGFSKARQLKDQLLALDQILKHIEDFKDRAADLQPVVAAVEAAAAQNLRLNTARAFELTLARDELCSRIAPLMPDPNAPTLATLVQREEGRMAKILAEIPSAKHRRVLNALPEAFGDGWVPKGLQLMLNASPRLVGEFADLLKEHTREDELRAAVDRWIREHSATPEILYWLCKDRDSALTKLVRPRLMGAILSALERDQFGDIKRGSKLQAMVLEDRTLVSDLLGSADREIVRDTMRKLLLTPVFDELDKRSLMGRIIKLHPEMQALLTSADAGVGKQESLVVSWFSLEKVKADFEELVNKKIPENSKEIGVARSYGDLRENFEFKAAKEMQAVLMRQKAETEQMLNRARGTNFENPDTSKVSIGTIVALRDKDSGVIEKYSVLGAWDGDPARGFVSYLTAIGQALLGHTVGESIELPTEHGVRHVEILSIEAFPIEQLAGGAQQPVAG